MLVNGKNGRMWFGEASLKYQLNFREENSIDCMVGNIEKG